ncbi:MAG: type IV pilus assembly protein PilM [Sedimentisphaerales bacterium]|nr:type IV pilus assembly protein PilM [Sedimentisphaerales bacterium]
MAFDFKKLLADWKNLTDLKKEEVVGLDVGSSSVKLVHLRHGVGGYVVVAVAKVDIGITEQDDERARMAKTAAAVRVCFEQSKIETRQVVCGVCGQDVAVRPFNFPALPPEEIQQAIMLEAEQVCPFDPGKNILEYQLVTRSSGLGARGSSDERQATSDDISGVLVAATNEVVRGKLQIVNNASLNCALMDIDGLALVNCFCQTESRSAGKTTALLNVGHTVTNLAVVHDQKPPFLRDIPHGGSEIIEHIAAERGLTREAAARAAISGADEYKECLAGGMSELVSEINESIRYYMSEQRLQSIGKVYVCGGFSLAKGFVELLNKQLPFGAQVWNPFDAMGRLPNMVGLEIVEASGPAMAVAAGLAMRTL